MNLLQCPLLFFQDNPYLNTISIFYRGRFNIIWWWPLNPLFKHVQGVSRFITWIIFYTFFPNKKLFLNTGKLLLHLSSPLRITFVRTYCILDYEWHFLTKKDLYCKQKSPCICILYQVLDQTMRMMKEGSGEIRKKIGERKAANRGGEGQEGMGAKSYLVIFHMM